MLNTSNSGSNGSTVCIVDDEPSVRASLTDLFDSVDIQSEPFVSAIDFLDRWDIGRGGCILLDMQMPLMSGLDLQERLTIAGSTLPIIFMSGQHDVPSSISAFRAGAADFILKPFESGVVVSATTAAMKRNAQFQIDAARRDAAFQLAATLTRREREVMGLVCEGQMNKQIAFAMGISEIMVKLHRGRMMRKMDSRSVADLVRKFDLLHNPA